MQLSKKTYKRQISVTIRSLNVDNPTQSGTINPGKEKFPISSQQEAVTIELWAEN